LVNTRTRYIVYTHSGGGVRHHHFSTQNNIIDEADGQASKGDTIPAQGFPIQFFQGQPVPFAFMSVNGAADGNHLYTDPGNQNVPVGEKDIDILVVYAPPGGIGSGGGPGVWVDAFNVDVGDFSDSDFIQVLTPPTPPDTLDAAKTSHANMEGDISTVTAENMRCFATVDGAPFVEWKKIVPTPTIITTRDVSLATNQTGEIWFAFYQSQPTSGGISHLKDIIAIAVGKWVSDDYCGTPWPHHIGPGGPPFRVDLGEKLNKALTTDQRAKLARLNKSYKAEALSAYKSMQKVQSLLKDVAAIAAAAEKKAR
jgi:hypothetical protein